jgi:hypothetical protein
MRQITESRSHTVVLAVVFSTLALGLSLQARRFERTPAYANLLDLFPQPTWAVIYAVAAVLMIIGLRYHTSRVLLSVTHTVSIVLLGSWWLAFVIRWATDGGTTVVNVLSWGVFLYVAVRAAIMVDARPYPPARR